MQRYAEEAVDEHMSSLQKAFFREKKGSSTAPYTSNRGELSDEQRKRLIQTAVKQSERGRVARVAGLSDEELKKQFDRSEERRVGKECTWRC